MVNACTLTSVDCSRSPDLYDDGFCHVVNVDFEEKVVQDMARQHTRLRPLMTWRVMDMTDMKALPDASFDAVIDKGAIGMHTL
jgi:Methyltransferase domain